MDRRVSGLTIRAATLADIPRAAEIFLKARLLAYSPIMPESVIRETAAPDLPIWRRWVEKEPPMFFLAETEAGVQGLLLLEETRLDSLHVDPASHGHGLGRALFEFARDQIGPGMDLVCLVGNDRAKRFYEKAGLRNAGRIDQPTGNLINQAYRFVYDG